MQESFVLKHSFIYRTLRYCLFTSTDFHWTINQWAFYFYFISNIFRKVTRSFPCWAPMYHSAGFPGTAVSVCLSVCLPGTFPTLFSFNSAPQAGGVCGAFCAGLCEPHPWGEITQTPLAAGEAAQLISLAIAVCWAERIPREPKPTLCSGAMHTFPTFLFLV